MAKKDVYHVKPMTEEKKKLINSIMDMYNIETATDIEDALVDLLGPTMKEMRKAEADDNSDHEEI